MYLKVKIKNSLYLNVIFYKTTENYESLSQLLFCKGIWYEHHYYVTI